MFKQIWETNLTDAYYRANLEAVAQIRFSEDGSVYRWICNKAGETIYPGYVVFYGTSTGADMLDQVFQMNQTGKGTSLALMAGVAMATLSNYDASDSTKRCYGWIQIHGYHGAVYMDADTTAIAVGTNCIGANGSFAAKEGTAAGTAPTYPRRIVALEALATTAGTAYKKAFIHCFQ